MRGCSFYLISFGVVSNAEHEVSDAGAGKIVGGTSIDISAAPFTFSFQVNGRHVCGSFLIHSFFVLTAAHCFDAIIARNISVSYLNVRGGSADSTIGGDFIGVEKFILHKKFNRTNLDYDAALVRLSRRPYFDHVYIEIGRMKKFPPVPGELLYVVGWGATREGGPLSYFSLKGVWVTAFENSICRNLFSKTGRVILESMLCAGVLEGSHDTCKGDSGGPLFDELKGIVGIVSWGHGCARPHYLGVYTRISFVYDWVKKILRKFNRTSRKPKTLE